MHADPVLRVAVSARTAPNPLAAFCYVALSIVAVLTLFWPTTLSMIETWSRSSGTFQHCFAVIPIALWLIWNRREALAATPVRPFWPGVGLIALLGLGWLLGVLGEAQFISQFVMICLVSAFVWTVFGSGWARVIWFALAFMFFAVPFGEAVVPWLMDWTADFTVAALRLSGVPVYREGNQLVVPTGEWSVVEACSGIRFLIASLMAGSLYAWLLYRSARKRIAFMAASVVVPILANWVRAYAIVLIGHLTNNRHMTGEDHVQFGWVLFGAVMLAMYWIGARWREDDIPVPDSTLRATLRPVMDGALTGRRLVPAFLLAGAALAVWPALSRVLLEPMTSAQPASIAGPEGRAGWQPSEVPLAEWQPDLVGSSERASFVFRKGEWKVGVFIAAFRNQTRDSQLATAANQVVRSTDDRWKQTSRGRVSTGDLQAVPADAKSATLRRRGQMDQLAIWHWYWVGARATTSDLHGKWRLALARLTRQPDSGLWIAIFTPVEGSTEEAAAVLRDFVNDMDGSLLASFNKSVAR